MDLTRPSGFHGAIPTDADSKTDPHILKASLTPITRARALSDSSQSTPIKLSPSPLIVESSRASKDDSSIKESTAVTPVTPIRASFPRKASGLAAQLPAPSRDFGSPLGSSSVQQNAKPAPPSPKLTDHPQIYSSPTNIIPRRSRGLDFSRAATSLHHSTLAEQHNLDSSPTIGSSRVASHPHRRSGDYGSTEQSSSSLWSVMGGQDRGLISAALASGARAASPDTDSSSDNDVMDEDMEEPYITTPHIQRTAISMGWLGNAPVNSLMSYRDKTRPKKLPKRRIRTPMGLGFSNISKSPPSGLAKDGPLGMAHGRRDSISWQANQLHISNSDPDDSVRSIGDGADRSVIRKVTTKRGNLLPKTKGFARIKAALAEETAPIDSESRREAEVVRQVMESDRPEPRNIMPKSVSTTAHSSPNLAPVDSADEVVEDDMIIEATNALSAAWKKNPPPSGKLLWDSVASRSIGSGAPQNHTTPPLGPIRTRAMSTFSDDLTMESPLLASTTQMDGKPTALSLSVNMPQLPTAAEITRRINNKRRRDDDFDPMSFKRRAVSPSLSVHNSPIMQSPMQRDMPPWGPRPTSNGGDRPALLGTATSSSSASIESGTVNRSTKIPGRVGYQGMVDTNDGIMRMSIE
ncbi:hypothetical protein Cpir12675_006066 [Ceratocystis pirilliformis]|uniref:Protein byr4 n=1 Tax=Ceratocystis pirilliformis TaxID=259994 RepID=A0ABR3YLN7_9PEZI